MVTATTIARALNKGAWRAAYTVAGPWAVGTLYHDVTAVRHFTVPLGHDGAFAVDVRTERDGGVRINFLHR